MTSLRLLAAAMILAAFTLSGCGGSKAKAEPAPTPAASAPAYPACNADGDCAAQSQVCVSGTCKQCRDHGQCSSMGACGRCDAATGSCVKAEGCCAADSDCGSGRCVAGKCR